MSRLRHRTKNDFEKQTGTKLTFLPFFASAAIAALADHPTINATISSDNTHVTYHGPRHLGIAVDTPRGLLAPAIRNAEKLSVAELASAIADLAERTRNNTISTDELSGATFTLTNTGSRGALFDTPIINQPQVAILGTGTVVERVAPTPDSMGGHTISVRCMVNLALSYDHRLIDGADAARFLSDIKTRLERANFDPAV